MDNERIKKLFPYFNKFEVGISEKKETYMILSMQFPDNWVVVDDIKTKFGVDTYLYQGLTIFSSDINTPIDNIFDAVDYNIEKMKAAEERKRLLVAKNKQLVMLFADESNSLESLRNLVFGTEGKIGEIHPFTTPASTTIETPVDQPQPQPETDEEKWFPEDDSSEEKIKPKKGKK